MPQEQLVNNNLAHSRSQRPNQPRVFSYPITVHLAMRQPSSGASIDELPLDLSIMGSRKRPAPIGLAAVASRINAPHSAPAPVNLTFQNNLASSNNQQQQLNVLAQSQLSVTPNHQESITASQFPNEHFINMSHFGVPNPAGVNPSFLQQPPFCYFPLSNWSPPPPPAQLSMQVPVPLAVLQHAVALGDLHAISYAQSLQRSAALASLTNQSSNSAQKFTLNGGQSRQNNLVDQEVGFRGPFQSPMMTPPPSKIARQQLPQLPPQHQQIMMAQHRQQMMKPAIDMTNNNLRAQLQQPVVPILPRPTAPEHHHRPSNAHNNGNNPVLNWQEDTVKQVNTCLICRRSFDSLPALTQHMAETKHFKTICGGGGGNGSSAIPMPNVRRSTAQPVATSPANLTVSPAAAGAMMPSSSPNVMINDQNGTQNVRNANPLTMTPPCTPVENKRYLAPQYHRLSLSGQTVIRDIPVFPTPSLQDDEGERVDVVDQLDGAEKKSGNSEESNASEIATDCNDVTHRKRFTSNNNPLTKLCQFVDAAQPQPTTSSPIKAVAMTNNSPFNKSRHSSE